MNKVLVELSDKEQAFYNQLKKDMLVTLGDKEIDVTNAAVLSCKLIQMASGSVYGEEQESIHLHYKKLEALEDLIEGANGKPLLVVYWYKHDLLRIKERLDVRELKSKQDFRDWNKSEIPVAVIHPASAGHGLNLQAGGSTIVWFTLTWSLELYEQTNARLYRQGQTESIMVYNIVTQDTMDDQVLKALEKKVKLMMHSLKPLRRTWR